jgi:hypothetical protein
MHTWFSSYILFVLNGGYCATPDYVSDYAEKPPESIDTGDGSIVNSLAGASRQSNGSWQAYQGRPHMPIW